MCDPMIERAREGVGLFGLLEQTSPDVVIVGRVGFDQPQSGGLPVVLCGLASAGEFVADVAGRLGSV
jgi:hypothetical protein